MDKKQECQWTACDKPAKGPRTDGHFTKLLCKRHLRLTSRKPS
jgi:hypothetical protein